MLNSNRRLDVVQLNCLLMRKPNEGQRRHFAHPRRNRYQLPRTSLHMKTKTSKKLKFRKTVANLNYKSIRIIKVTVVLVQTPIIHIRDREHIFLRGQHMQPLRNRLNNEKLIFPLQQIHDLYLQSPTRFQYPSLNPRSNLTLPSPSSS